MALRKVDRPTESLLYSLVANTAVVIDVIPPWFVISAGPELPRAGSSAVFLHSDSTPNDSLWNAILAAKPQWKRLQ